MEINYINRDEVEKQASIATIRESIGIAEDSANRIENLAASIEMLSKEELKTILLMSAKMSKLLIDDMETLLRFLE